jgi:hypothetical protein
MTTRRAGEWLKPNMRAQPSGVLRLRALLAALRAACALPQSVTRCLGAPSNYQRHQCIGARCKHFSSRATSNSGCAEAARAAGLALDMRGEATSLLGPATLLP